MSPRFDAIGLVVKDMARSIAFYRRLGVEFPEPEGHGHLEATLRGGIRFMIDTVDDVKSFDPAWTPPKEGHQIGLAFLCDSAEEVDGTYKMLIQEGAESYKEPWDAVWGQRYAQVKDPDGNVVDLFAPLGKQA